MPREYNRLFPASPHLWTFRVLLHPVLFGQVEEANISSNADSWHGSLRSALEAYSFEVDKPAYLLESPQMLKLLGEVFLSDGKHPAFDPRNFLKHCDWGLSRNPVVPQFIHWVQAGLPREGLQEVLEAVKLRQSQESRGREGAKRPLSRERHSSTGASAHRSRRDSVDSP
jgi:hypothetical protein